MTYTSYFGFQEEPFSLTPTSRLFYSNPVYEEVYTKLLAGVRQRLGFMLLTGEVGTGKTTLLRRLMNGLLEDPAISTFSSHYYQLTFEELLSSICSDLGIETHTQGLQEIAAFTEFLLARSRAGGSTVLLLDEAQEYEEELLDHLFAWWHTLPSSEHLQVVLVGQQPELEEKLRQPRLHQLGQQVAVRCRLEHLQPDEVKTFIHHRLRLVGCARSDLFTQEALQLIALYSQGIPRVVNLLCDNALRKTYENSHNQVSAELILAVARNFRLEERQMHRPENEDRQGASLVGPLEVRNHLSLDAPRSSTQEVHINREATFRPMRPMQPKRLSKVLAGSGVAGGLVVVGIVFLLLNDHFMRRQTPEPDALAPVVADASASSSQPERAVDALAKQTAPVSPTPAMSDPNHLRVQRGKTVLQRLAEKDRDIRPLAWGLGTETPVLALLLPVTEWDALSRESQLDLTWYLEALIPSVRSQPEPYLEEFHSAPTYKMFRAKLAHLCGDCWLIAVSRQTDNAKHLLFDEVKVIVQGDSVGEYAAPANGGMKASEFRGAAQSAR